MADLQTGYQALTSCDNDAETPQESSVLIHVVPESGKARWNHVEDLDSFFTKIYQYHQKHGLTCMMLQDVMELVQFLFVVIFTTFLVQCVEYPVLFKDKQPVNNATKVKLSDAFKSPGECLQSFSPTLVICLFVSGVFWTLRVVKVAFNILQYIEIKAFYTSALKISSDELNNMTWHEVQRRVLEVQKDQQMCIHKRELSEIDIYHRILRFKNYTVAMVNKELLPLKGHVPLIGDVVFLTQGLKYNLELILFWGPWAPFENNWHLKEDYKKVGKRKELADKLSKHILWIGVINFIFLPLIFLWQVLNTFFNYADLVKREPGFLGTRMWSLYGRLYLRHFNELDHELNARLCRGYKPGSQYMNIFTSHFVTIIAKNIAFFAGAVLAVLLALTIYDEDVITVEHVLTLITFLGMILAVCRGLIPDEYTVWCPERLMKNIVAHIHYVPDSWSGFAHTFKVRDEFSHLFQYKAVHLLEELLSPLLTPVILIFYLRPKCLDIVDFFRNFTVEVVGVGDVCSFAQMDVRRHGNPQWMTEGHTEASQYQQAENGKTELSLMHFTHTNPHWIPPVESSAFLANIKEQVQRDAAKLHVLKEDNPLYYSLYSLSSLGAGYLDLATSVFRTGQGQEGLPGGEPLLQSSRMFHSDSAAHKIIGGLSQTEGPLGSNQKGLLSSIQAPEEFSSTPPAASETSLEITTANMSFSTLYMHELHQRQLRQRNNTDVHSRLVWQRPLQDLPDILESPQEGDHTEEKQPLLPDPRSRMGT